MTLEQLNALEEPRALQELMRCCGSARWAMAVMKRRPFQDVESLRAAADEAWAHCGPDDWREAFSHHPRIGEKKTQGWAQGEQAGVAAAPSKVLEDLARENADYERKFGHVFLVCATGKTADEMLALLRARMPGEADAELKVAAGEQAKITRLRLDKLLSA